MKCRRFSANLIEVKKIKRKQGIQIFVMVNKFAKVLIIMFTTAFSIACGLFLVRFSIPLYFKLFSPIPKTLHNFYIAIGIFSFLIIPLDIILFKKGKYNWGILILGTAVLLLGFGIPMFMLENNNMLWHEAVFSKPGPVYFIEFSEKTPSVLKYFHDLYMLIWSKVYLYNYWYIILYLSGYFYLRKLGWRTRGVRIKL